MFLDTVKAKEVPGTSQSFAPEISHISVLDDTGVHSEESSVIYRLRSAAVGFSKKSKQIILKILKWNVY